MKTSGNVLDKSHVGIRIFYVTIALLLELKYNEWSRLQLLWEILMLEAFAKFGQYPYLQQKLKVRFRIFKIKS